MCVQERFRSGSCAIVGSFVHIEVKFLEAVNMELLKVVHRLAFDDSV